MGLFTFRKCSTTTEADSKKAQAIMKSRVELIEPPEGSNLARELIKAFKQHDNKVLMVDGQKDGTEYTGKDIWERTARLATGFMKSEVGMSVGDNVLLICRHSVIEKIISLATLYTGATMMGTEPSGLEATRLFCEPSKPQVIIAHNDEFETAKRLRDEVDGMQDAKIVLYCSDAAKLIETDEQEKRGVILGYPLFDWPEIDEDLIMERVNKEINPKKDYSMLMVTSGSTGRSKVVPWTHEKQLYDIWSIISASKNGLDPDSTCSLLPVGDFVLAGDLTMEQGAGVMAMIWCFIVGSKYVVIEPQNVEQFWRDVTKYKLTMSIGSSTFTYKLLKQLINWLKDPPEETIDISSMKYIACVGTRVNIEPLMEILRPVYKNLDVTQFYGATEIGYITMLSRDDSRKSFDSVGHLFPGVQAKVVKAETNEPVGQGEEGEMLIKSPSLFEHYLPHPEETLEECMKNRFDEYGFYRTGDLVHYDAEQKFYIHARLKDTLFLDQDWKVAPSDIEGVVDEHPVVDSSVVIGIPHPIIDGCVVPKAFIKLKTIKELEQFPVEPAEEYHHVRNLINMLESGQHDEITKDVEKYVNSYLPQLMQPVVYTILDDFPKIRGRNTKIDRQKLKNMG